MHTPASNDASRQTIRDPKHDENVASNLAVTPEFSPTGCRISVICHIFIFPLGSAVKTYLPQKKIYTNSFSYIQVLYEISLPVPQFLAPKNP